MKKRRVLSVGTQVKLGGTLPGIFWIVAGIFGFFDNTLCRLIEIAFFGMALVCFIMLLVCKKEETDEMAEANMDAAKAYTLSVARVVLVCGSLAMHFVPKDFLTSIDWSKVLPSVSYLFLGVLDVISGITFKQYEEEE